MDNFTFYSPTFFAFGKGMELEAGKYVKEFGGSKALLHYGGGSVVRSGLLDRVKGSLEEAGVSYVELGAFSRTPEAVLYMRGSTFAGRKGWISSWP